MRTGAIGGRTTRHKVDAAIAAIDWTSPTPPRGYKYGIGRGDHGFITNVMQSNIGRIRNTTSDDDAMMRQLDAIEESRRNANHKRGRTADEGADEIGGAGGAGGAGTEGESTGGATEERSSAMHPKVQRLESLADLETVLGSLGDIDKAGVALKYSGSGASKEGPAPVAKRSAVDLAAALASEHHLRVDSAVQGGHFSTTAGPITGATLHANATLDEVMRVGSDSEPTSWLSRANILLHQQRFKKALEVLMQGAQLTGSDALFLKAIEMEEMPSRKREIAALATRQCRSSPCIWLKAAELQVQESDRRTVLEEGVLACPRDDALLLALVECYPANERFELLKGILKDARHENRETAAMWISFAQLLPAAKARDVLLKALERLPHEEALWAEVLLVEERLLKESCNGSEAQQAATATRIAEIAGRFVKQFVPAPAAVVAVARKDAAAGRHTSALALLRTTFGPAHSSTWVEDLTAHLGADQEAAGDRQLLLVAWALLLECCGEKVSGENGIAAPPVSTDADAVQAADGAHATSTSSGGSGSNSSSSVRAAITWICDELGADSAPAAEPADSASTHTTGGWRELARRTADTFCNDGVLQVACAKLFFRRGDLATASAVLQRALANPAIEGGEEVPIGAAKVEALQGNWEAAQHILQDATTAPNASPRAYMKLAMLHRERGCRNAELEVLEAGVARFPAAAPKLWLMLLLHTARHAPGGLRHAIERAVSPRACRHDPRVFAYAATLMSELLANPRAARNLLDEAMSPDVHGPGRSCLWEARLEIERAHGPPSAAVGVVKAAIAASAANCTPLVGFWRIELAAPSERGRVAQDVARRFPRHGLIDVATGRLLWLAGLKERSADRLLDALKAFRRAVRRSPHCGDCHAQLLRFVLELQADDAEPYNSIFAPDTPEQRRQRLVPEDRLIRDATAPSGIARGVLNEGPLVWIRRTKTHLDNVSIRGPVRPLALLLRDAAGDPLMHPAAIGDRRDAA